MNWRAMSTRTSVPGRVTHVGKVKREGGNEAKGSTHTKKKQAASDPKRAAVEGWIGLLSRGEGNQSREGYPNKPTKRYMAMNKGKNELTEQGYGGPEPVGVGSVRVGSPRPSSNDHSVHSVGNQASALDLASGDMCVDPFKRRDSITRSPPLIRDRCHSVPDTDWLRKDRNTIAEWTDDNPAKRKRKEKDASKSNKDEMDELIPKLVAKAKEFEGLIKASANTKTEIKRAGLDILHMTIKLQRLNIDRPRGNATSPSIEKTSQARLLGTDQGTQTVMETVIYNKEVRDASTQTLETNNIDMEESVKNLRAEINRDTSYDHFLNIYEKRWPRSVFTRVQEAVGDIMAAPWEQDLVNTTTSDLNMTKGVARRFRERYGGLEELKAQNGKLGGVAFMANSISIPTDKGYIKKERYIWHMLIETEPMKLANLEDMYNSADKLKELLLKHGRKKVAIARTATYNWDTVEKILEYVFSNTQIDIFIYKPEVKQAQKKRRKDGSVTAPQSKNLSGAKRFSRPIRDAVIISANGKTYADLVKGLRKEVSLDDTDIEISKMRKTQKGDLLLEIKKGDAEELKSVISSKLQGTQVTKRVKESIFHIKGMDGGTTKDEILEAIKKTLKEEVHCRITSLRPAYAGSQNATIILDSLAAVKLKKMKSIKIGWLYCPIKERIQWDRCQRCWDFDHKESSCKGPNRKDLCLKCAQPGHKAKDCVRNPFCPLCNKEGHQAGGIRCDKRPQIVEP